MVTKKRAIAIGTIAILAVIFFVGLGNLFTNWNGYLWNKASIEKFLETPIPADANYVEFDGHRGRGGGLNLTFEASDESVEAFVSKFCGNTLYQGYDPFNAIDTEEHRIGAYRIKMDQVSYYSYSPDTPDNLFGIRCYSDKGQIQILVNKTFGDIGHLKMEVLFTCYKCNIQ